VEIYRRGQYREAAALFRRTVAIDPAFPSAHLMLGWSLRYQGLQDEAVESGRRAMALLDQATPAEQAFIQGTYHYWREEYEEAWSHFELLLELEPEHPWAMFVLTTMAKRLGRFDRMAQLIQQAAAANPNLLVVQTRGASILTGVLARLDLARPLIARARAIASNSMSSWGDEAGWLGAWISSFGIWERWLEGDTDGALSEADRVRGWLEGKWPQTLSPQRHANFLALQYLTLGRVKDARKLLRDFGAAPGLYLPEMTVLSSAAPDDELMRKFQQAPPGSAKALLRLLLLPPSSDGRTIGLPPPGPDEPREGPIFLAGVAIGEDRPEEAIEELRRAKELIFEGRVVAPGYLNFAVPYVLRQSLVLLELARLHEANGQPALAIEALEELSSSRDQSYPLACIVWLFGRAYLADLYRRTGRAEEAETVENELRALLEYADDDHPLRAKLSR
jgi:tetratricopeptide (TPR) repeat protein